MHRSKQRLVIVSSCEIVDVLTAPKTMALACRVEEPSIASESDYAACCSR
jgi:hypothetical protein